MEHRSTRLDQYASAFAAMFLAACAPSFDESGDTEAGPADVLVTEADAPLALAQLQCALLYECECADPGYGDLDACVRAKTAAYERTARLADNRGLQYDEECLSQWAQHEDDMSCLTWHRAPSRNPTGPSCSPYYRPSSDRECEAVDDPGWSRMFASTCGQGEQCVDGLCHLPWFDRGADLGEACEDYEPLSCRQPFVCSDEVCIERLRPGQRCFEVFVPCVNGYTCDPISMTCESLSVPGAPCEEEGVNLSCSTGDCRDGTCFDEPRACAYRADP